MITKEREIFLLGKAEGLALARIEFGKLISISTEEQFSFYKTLDSETAKVQIELETGK